MTTAPLASLAVTVMSFGRCNAGAVESATVTENVPVAVFPAASVAIHDTVVVPRANVDPEVGVQTTTGLGSTSSVAVTANVTGAPSAPVASATMSVGNCRTGAVESVTVTENVPVPVFPAASVAVHDTVVVPRANVDPEVGVQTTTGLGSTSSVAVTANVTGAPSAPVASATMSVGNCRTGAVISATVTKKAPVATFPALSVAVQDTTVVPTAKTDPDGGAQSTTGLGSTSSVAVAVKVTGAPSAPVAAAVMSIGSCNTGAVESVTVTEKAPVAAFPALSVAVHDTVVVPIGKADPDGGAQLGTTTPSTASFAVAPNVTPAPFASVAITVMSLGKLSIGAVISATVTENVPVPVFPAVSVAVQDTTVVPTAKTDPDGGAQSTTGLGSTSSVAVAVKVTGAPSAPIAATVMSIGSCNTGAVESVTVTENVPVPTFPAASVAVHDTGVVPIGNVDPDAGEQVTGTSPLTRSVAVALKVTTAPDADVADILISAGRARLGGVESTTVTEKLSFAEFPAASLAVHDTVVVPRANVDPEVGAQATTGLGSTSSVAVAVKVTGAPSAPVASTTTSAGNCNTGGVVSTIVTVTAKVPDAKFPAASVAVHDTGVVPIGNVDPDAGEQLGTTTPSTASFAVALNDTTAPDTDVAGTLIFAGKLRIGAVVSATVTKKLPVCVLLAASVAVHDTVVVPTGNVDPDAGEQVGTTTPSTASFAVALNDTTAPDTDVAGTVIFAGRLRVGGVVSDWPPGVWSPTKVTPVVEESKVSEYVPVWPAVAEETTTYQYVS
nr:hypothetical protein [Antricoccus suffuscus]